ncbi:hypothetical protein HYH39_02220 [Clostridium botulinum]|nr:hypothetical protein KU40_17210 [Clostridium botulinum]MBY6778069.1 hypothetical protein [Clostridium botulinum]MBY6850943.1 hypothetical protein [Clostridium botulinum]NFF25120.1 hypothetical protein [Clostridium botulinum]NFI50063.1 hypothetical protein [Clostridium botulinum]
MHGDYFTVINDIGYVTKVLLSIFTVIFISYIFNITNKLDIKEQLKIIISVVLFIFVSNFLLLMQIII